MDAFTIFSSLRETSDDQPQASSDVHIGGRANEPDSGATGYRLTQLDGKAEAGGTIFVTGELISVIRIIGDRM